MNFLVYLSNRSQELIVERNKKGMGVWRDMEINSMDKLFTLYLFVSSVAYFPVIFIKYFMVLFKISRSPIPSLQIAGNENLKRHEKQKRKLGMITPKKEEGYHA